MSCDMELFHNDGKYYQVKNSRLIQETKKTKTYEADIQGDIRTIQDVLSKEMDTQVIIVPRNSSL